MTGERRRWNIGARKIPFADRDVVHGVLADGDRGWRDIIGADTDDDDERHPLGAHVAYTLELTDAEADRFRRASNSRWVELDRRNEPHRSIGRPTGTPLIPTATTLAYLRLRYLDLTRWHGRDVPVAVLDQGTTAAVRAAMGFTLLGRTIVSGVTLGPGQELVNPAHSHGCLVAPNAVPAGGQLLDCIISGDDGSAADSAIASGITWAADNGAKVINISFGGGPGATPASVLTDAAAYASTHGGAQIVSSAGNDNAADMSSPAAMSRTQPNVWSSVAFDENTDRRALFSNHAADASGCGPGVHVTSLDIFGNPLQWNGTSASSPHMAQLIARGATGGTYTTAQVAQALHANPRDTGAGAAEQGAGAWDLQRALVALGALPAVSSTTSAVTVSVTDARGAAGLFSSYTVAAPPGVQPDDLRLVVLVSSANAGLERRDGWRLLVDAHYDALFELAAEQNVGPTRCRVLAKPWVAGEPDPAVFSFGGGSWFSGIAALTLRGAGGLDPEKFAPVVKMGTGATADAAPVLPNSVSDLQVVAFAQRHPNALTGSFTMPGGLTQQGFWRPSAAGTTTGYPLVIATQQLASSNRTATYTATSNDSTGTWCSVALTIPAAPTPIPTVTQTEPAGPPGALLPFLPRG